MVDIHLDQEVAYHLNHYRVHNVFPKPSSLYFSAYIGTTDMPPALLEQVRSRSEGFHEFYLENKEIHIAVVPVPELTEPLFILYEVTTLEFTEKRKTIIAVVLVGSVLLVVILGLWLGIFVSKRVVAPVIYLADLVRHTELDNLPTNISPKFYDDEVGVLARTIERSMERVRAHIEREKNFTRNASHELRTPVTIIKGALEILKKRLNSEDEKLKQPLGRLSRAVANMDATINNLLWLARGEIDDEPNQSCDVLPLVHEVVDNLRYLPSHNSVEIECQAEVSPILTVRPEIFRIVIANLVKNAIQYTRHGRVIIQVFSDRVVVMDTGIGIASRDLPKITEPYFKGDQSQGSGLGLAIVKNICQRFNWKFDIESNLDQGTTARLIFPTSRA